MKLLLIIVFSLSMAWAQDPALTLKNFDAKTYTLQSKGIKDLVVDVESTSLSQQVNEQQIFGKVKELTFRLFWTANPERLAVEVMGLPEGFKEVKEDLKLSLLTQLEPLLAPGLSRKYSSYKFQRGQSPGEVVAKENSGMVPIPGFTFKFDAQNRLFEIVGHKNVGTLVIKPKYSKESFSDGKWVLKELRTENSENGQLVTVVKSFDYSKAQGIGVLSEIETELEQKVLSGNSKPIVRTDSLTLKNYKLNEGEAMKYFLIETPTENPKK